MLPLGLQRSWLLFLGGGLVSGIYIFTVCTYLCKMEDIIVILLALCKNFCKICCLSPEDDIKIISMLSGIFDMWMIYLPAHFYINRVMLQILCQKDSVFKSFAFTASKTVSYIEGKIDTWWCYCNKVQTSVTKKKT